MVKMLLQLDDITHRENKSFWLFTLHISRKKMRWVSPQRRDRQSNLNRGSKWERLASYQAFR